MILFTTVIDREEQLNFKSLNLFTTYSEPNFYLIIKKNKSSTFFVNLRKGFFSGKIGVDTINKVINLLYKTF